MKTTSTKCFFTALLITFGAANTSFAQTTLTLNPATLTPAPTGYYTGGVYKDKNNDGVNEFYNECVDEYGDADHDESGAQQGFTYTNVMIMPTCAGKGTAPMENWPAAGYVQLTKHKNPGTPEAAFGAIMTPLITNLNRLEVKVGSDVSINAGRRVFMGVESSLNGGQTWEGPFFVQELTNQGGHIFSYEAGGSEPGFNAIATASNTQAIMVRVMSTPAPGATEGQRLKIFGMTVVANVQTPTAVKSGIEATKPFYQISDKAFVGTRGDLHVYSITGALVGSGQSVQIPRSGLYIVRSEQGFAKKVFVQ